uniref:Uncharacterized protein n=1 Tax=Plectus sambesii TaxID=2011161 RepID=A0A914UXT0_9BILA
MIWLDEFLRWDPKDFDGIDQLLLPICRIWYPDVMAENVIDTNAILSSERNFAIIDYNGNITISIDEVITMHCNFFVTNFPFDVQNCTLKFTSWMHSAKLIELSTTFPSDLRFYKPNSAWDLVSFTSRHAKNVYGVSTTAFSDRKPVFYLSTFVLPSFIITTLAIVGVFSPFNDSGDREEKVTMGLTTLLTMAVILLLITDQMPKSSARMPLLGLFMVIQIGLSASATLTAVLIMYQHNKWTTGVKVPDRLLALTRITRDASDKLQGVIFHYYVHKDVPTTLIKGARCADNRQICQGE